MQLAIIIPAFKSEFFKACLDSIASQTDKRFILYIGDDHSPDDLETILTEFKGKVNYEYTRFDENLGSKDLVAHWERCINLSKNEPWIWMFSDDDVMDSNCVAEFYNEIEKDGSIDLLHYNLKMIDSGGAEYYKPMLFRDTLTIQDFFEQRIQFQISSFVIEFIFKRDAFIESGGFQNFDLAWCTDDATWIKLGRKAGIRSIRNAYVKWRFSGINISALINEPEIIERKLSSSLNYLKWVKGFFKNHHIIDTTSSFMKIKWALYTVLNSRSLSIIQKVSYAIRTAKSLKYSSTIPLVVIYTIYYGIGKFVSSIIRNSKNA